MSCQIFTETRLFLLIYRDTSGVAGVEIKSPKKYPIEESAEQGLLIDLRRDHFKSEGNQTGRQWTAISMQMLAFLGAGVPVRGAIELGWGTHIEEDSIYGTMLHRAFRLEKEAGYPRIIIGQNLLNYILPLATHPQQGVSDEVARIAKRIGKEALSQIIEDDDGELVLNYLRKESYAANEDPFNKSVKSAKEFIRSEIARRRQSRETKLMGNYCKLRRFFQRCNAW